MWKFAAANNLRVEPIVMHVYTYHSERVAERSAASAYVSARTSSGGLLNSAGRTKTRRKMPRFGLVVAAVTFVEENGGRAREQRVGVLSFCLIL